MDLANDYNDTTDYNELFLAVHNGDVKLVNSLLGKHSTTTTIRGRTLLHVATARGHTELAKLFMTKRDETGNTPLHLTIMENQSQVFNLLLGETNLNAKNLKEESPLHYAAFYDRPEFAKTLLANDATVEVKNKEGKTPLYVALTKGHVQVTEVLFKHGAVLTKEDLTNIEPLCDAVAKRNFEMVKLLMANGFNTIDVPNRYYSPLRLAVIYETMDILKYLMKNGLKNSKTINKDSHNLLKVSIKMNRMNSLKYLVDIGVKTVAVEDLMYETIRLKRYAMWQYLVKVLSKICATTHFKEKQLHFSIRMGQVESVKAIVNDPTNEYISDPLAKMLAVHIAAETGNEEILETLLNARYPVESLFKVITPIHVAATHKHPGLVKLFLKAKVDVNLRTKQSLTPLHFAAIATQPAVVEFLLKNGADPIEDYRTRESPLEMSMLMFSFMSLHKPTSLLIFERLTKITELLIRYSANEMAESAIKMLIRTATQIKVASNNVEENNSSFRPEILRCIFNYLSDKRIQHFAEATLNDCYIVERTTELQHFLMEYDDSKTCCDIELSLRDKSYNYKLLSIHYSKNYADLLSYKIGNNSTVSDNKDNTVDEKNVLRLIIARLVLLIKNRHACLLKFCRNNELDDWRKKCMKERVRMRKTKVCKDSSITFHDALIESADKLAVYTSNRSFLKEIEFCEDKFPAYAEFIKTNIEIAERRKNFINECISLMTSLVRKQHRIRISKVEINLIFKYLSIIDLRRFSAASSQKLSLMLN